MKTETAVIEGNATLMPVMTREQAQAADAVIISSGKQMGAALLRISESEGWRLLDFKTFNDYLASITNRVGGKTKYYEVLRTARVERNVGSILGRAIQMLPTHSEALADLPTPEAQAEVYQLALGGEAFLPPTAKQLERAVASYCKTHGLDKEDKKKKHATYGWTAKDLDEDDDLRHALEAIGKVYGRPGRMAIQEGAVEMKGSEVKALAKLGDAKMREVEALLLENRWSLSQSLAFINTMPTDKTTVAELKNYVLTKKSRFFEARFGGFKLTMTKDGR